MEEHSIVIGGSRGIGGDYVRLIAEEGNRISVISRRIPEKSEGLAKTEYWSADLLSETAVIEVLNDIVKKRGKINHLVFFQRYRGDGQNRWKEEIDLSLTATRSIIEALSDRFAADYNKSIVAVSSLAASFVAEEQPLEYHVAKAGLNQLVRYYAVKLGPKGIRVNAVSPGTVIKPENQTYYQQQRKQTEFYNAITPLGRMGSSRDVANAVRFLCSQDAAFITGQNITVDGGLSLLLQASFDRHIQ